MAMAIQKSNMEFVDRTIQSCRDTRDICVETVMHGIKMGGNGPRWTSSACSWMPRASAS